VTLTELTWIHPVHGSVTESLCQRHEPTTSYQLAEFGIAYTVGPASDQQCHRCHEELRWHNRIYWHPHDGSVRKVVPEASGSC